RLVRQSPGAVPPHSAGLRHTGPRARHLAPTRRRLGVEGRRRDGATGGRRPAHGRAGRRNTRRGRADPPGARARRALVAGFLGLVGTRSRLADAELPAGRSGPGERLSLVVAEFAALGPDRVEPLPELSPQAGDRRLELDGVVG